MNIQTADGEKQGLMYQGRFSESLDFEPLRAKISFHLQFIRSQKDKEDTPQSAEIEHSATVRELN